MRRLQLGTSQEPPSQTTLPSPCRRHLLLVEEEHTEKLPSLARNTELLFQRPATRWCRHVKNPGWGGGKRDSMMPLPKEKVTSPRLGDQTHHRTIFLDIV
ncbi:hypothetical protein J4Q44_G00282080 [Coregonus suidteri]|uniref:Uncharacterized protein n=1 Tax=Coregonus suidteri TaxID=861788 RepID=A0AAN8LAI1_9TELE